MLLSMVSCYTELHIYRLHIQNVLEVVTVVECFSTNLSIRVVNKILVKFESE